MGRGQDKYFGANVALSDPANEAVPVVPSDNAFSDTARGLYVGVGGDISMKGGDDQDWVLWKNVPAGSFMPFRCKAIRVAGTTATNILALY